MPTDHKQVPIYCEGETIFTVDEKLESIIQFLVNKRIETIASCQDNIDDLAWISFTLEDWQFINNMAIKTENHDFLSYVEENCNVSLHSTDDGQPDENDEYWIPGKNLYWLAGVRFPKDDIDHFEKQLLFILGNLGTEDSVSIH